MLLCINPLFSLGQTVATPNALDLLAQHNTSCFSLLARHQSGDWGNLPAEDALSNQQAIECGYRIMSVYPLETGKVWIITEADRSVTTVLLPEEY